MSNPRVWKYAGSFVVIVLMLVLAAGSSDNGASTSGGGGSGSGSASAPTKIEAWVMTQQFVEDSLKSPGSAEYGGLFSDYQDPEQIVTSLGDGTFRVRAWVDAQNSFGAKIRTHFVCELKYVGNDRWQLISLDFLN